MTTSLSQKQIKDFQKEILEWYRKNQRNLPWRQTRNPYNILVSEVMSQQTQISRVIPKYEAWMRRFPTLQRLVEASTRDVLAYWSGLGYNRRALYLKKCAEEIVKNHRSEFPQDEKKLLKLPGIGEYTARALLCFAFDHQIAVVDTNVRKVILTRIMQYEGSCMNKDEKHNAYSTTHTASLKTVNEKEIEEIAQKLLPVRKASEWNQALMDYASEVLKKHKIPVPKQSRFKGSDRYYRGQILKKIIEEQTISRNELKSFIQKKNSALIETQRLEKIIKSLEKDKFIRVEGTVLKLL